MTESAAQIVSLPSEALKSDLETPSYRVLPHHEELEQALLGALLVDSAPIERIADFLKPEHFFAPVHGRIYDKILIMGMRGSQATPQLLRSLFENDEDLKHVGGARYLEDLAANVVTSINAYDYARAIYEAFIRRELIRLGEDVVNDAFAHDLEDPVDAQIGRAEAGLYNLAQVGEVSRGFVSLKSAVTEAVEIAEKAFKASTHVTGITCGFQKIDRRMGGFHPSDLIILAGRPSMGKTALATNMAYKAARKYVETDGKEGGIVAFFSLEMSASQLAARILADLSSVPSDKIRRGEIKAADFDVFVQKSAEMAETPLYIDDSAGVTISQIRTRARRIKRTHGLDMIFIDYLQLLSGSSRRSSENRVVEISEISRGLKTLAKELEVPVIALSQLSRQVEQRENKRPQLSDLRESGSIEQDADVVMFVYREEYYLERELPAQRPSETSEHYFKRREDYEERINAARNKAEIILGKQRHGPVGTEMLRFEGQFTRFEDLAEDEYGQ